MPADDEYIREGDNDVNRTTDNSTKPPSVSATILAEPQDAPSLRPVVTSIGVALGLALVIVLVLLRHSQHQRQRWAKSTHKLEEALRAHRQQRLEEEILYIDDPLDLYVIDKVLAEHSTDDDEDGGSETADESVEMDPHGKEITLMSIGKNPDTGKGSNEPTESTDSLDKHPTTITTTAVLKFHSASLMETPGKEEVEMLHMTGQHIFKTRRLSGGGL